MPQETMPSFGEEQEDSVWLSVKSFIWETVKVIVISLAIIIPVRYYVIQPFYVKGASMEPSYFDHEYLIIDEFSYHLREPRRGEVVVFRPPNDARQFYIKRVIGVPGDRVKITGGNVYRYNAVQPEGEQLDEPYLSEGTVTLGEVDVQLKDNQYFVLGDHRSASLDSRVFGPIERSEIVGRTWIRGWPLTRIAVFNTLPE
ncbi:MAG: signal peptidase I [Patescibacteria group bacterium]